MRLTNNPAFLKEIQLQVEQLTNRLVSVEFDRHNYALSPERRQEEIESIRKNAVLNIVDSIEYYS